MHDKLTKPTIFISLLMVTILLFLCATSSLAWFAEHKLDTEPFSATSIMSFFAGGDGSAESPFIINQPIHLYNLSWLQNTENAFLHGDEHFKISNMDGTPTVIDMGGKMSGTAIPPIGTNTKPFTGVFDGNGSVIKNLWVSTDEDDWAELPVIGETYEYLSTHVGLFGSIGESAVVQNFTLDRIEVTTHLSDTTVGIICGYVDARLENVKVFNGIISTSTEGVTNCKSWFSLVGEISTAIEWDEMPTLSTGGEGEGEGPGGQAGGLTINPSDFDTEYPHGATSQIVGSIPGTAFYVGSIGKMSLDASTTLYDLSPGGAGTSTAVDANYINDIDDTEKRKRLKGLYDGLTTTDPNERITDRLYVSYSNKNSTSYFPFGSAASSGDFIGATAQHPELATYEDDNNVSCSKIVPGPGFWFDPEVSGTAALAFFSTNNKTFRYMMIYKIERGGTAENPTFTVDEATEFEIPGTNGAVCYFEYNVDANYEYLISVSGIDGHYVTSPGQIPAQSFVYLHLAGTNATEGELPSDIGHGGGGGGGTTADYTKYISSIDYITKDELDAIADGGTISRASIQTLIRFINKSTGSGVSDRLFFTAEINDPNTTPYAYYYSTNEGFDFGDYAESPESAAGEAGDYYERRYAGSSDSYTPLSGGS